MMCRWIAIEGGARKACYTFVFHANIANFMLIPIKSDVFACLCASELCMCAEAAGAPGLCDYPLEYDQKHLRPARHRTAAPGHRARSSAVCAVKAWKELERLTQYSIHPGAPCFAQCSRSPAPASRRPAAPPHMCQLAACRAHLDAFCVCNCSRLVPSRVRALWDCG